MMDAEGWVLAGGQSRRMGRDKAAVMLGGVSLLARMLEKLQMLGLRARVAGLGSPIEGIRVEAIEDTHPACGPLSGLETALRHSDAGSVLVLGVDLPVIATSFLAWMLERAAVTGAMATIPCLLGEPQPLCAIYRRELLPSVSMALAIGDFKVMHAIERGVAELGGPVDFFDLERVATTHVWRSSWPVHLQFMNCNRPQDLAQAETLLAETPML